MKNVFRSKAQRVHRKQPGRVYVRDWVQPADCSLERKQNHYFYQGKLQITVLFLIEYYLFNLLEYAINQLNTQDRKNGSQKVWNSFENERKGELICCRVGGLTFFQWPPVKTGKKYSIGIYLLQAYDWQSTFIHLCQIMVDLNYQTDLHKSYFFNLDNYF